MADDVPSRPAAAAPAEQRRAEFIAAYDAVLAKWPAAVESVDVPSVFGTTRVQVCGPQDGAPLVLLHGGGATSTVWFANVAELSRTRRVYAVDQINGPGRSVHDGRRVTALDGLLDWLDAVFGHLRIASAGLCGHSYGGWLALNYAQRAPQRVTALALLDPTDCFAGLTLKYRLRAVPLFVAPSAQRMRAFLNWETGAKPLDPAWLNLMALGTELPRSKIVMPRRPAAELFRAATMPTLILLAEHSRAHDIRAVTRNARRLMPHATIDLLAGASHHTIPTEDSEQLNHKLTGFFS
jgi:pimeloyl-ACP methyl ester carboxylesterase